MASPTALQASTVAKMKRPGKIASHGSLTIAGGDAVADYAVADYVVADYAFGDDADGCRSGFTAKVSTKPTARRPASSISG